MRNLTITEHVHILNESIRLKNLAIESLPEQIKPFLNQKIVKVDGVLLDKFKKMVVLPSFDPIPLEGGKAILNYRILKVQYTSFMFDFSICFFGGSYDDNSYYCHYESDSIYLGSVDNQDLVKINQFELLDVIDAKEELQKINDYLELSKKADALKRKINISESIYKYF